MSAAGVVGSTWRRSTRWWDSGRLWSGARADQAVLVAMAALCLLQNPGAVAFDTKLDLLVDPGAFLTRALDAWDPTANFGQVQNQAYGYLFPMGPVFWLLHAVGLPPWLVQASWAFLALAAAYLGCRVLCRRLGMTALAGIAAALAYALAPRLVTVLGPLSAEAWPVALLPWAMAPLLGTPVLSRRRAAGLSALAVLLMGAANAALTLAVLPAVGLALLARRDLRLAALWSGFVAMVSVWWVVPLLVQARVATPFLDLIESATVTTSSNDPAAVLRGTDHWVAGIVGVDGPWWPAGHDLLTVPLLVVVTVLVASVGLLGLVAGRVPHRRLWAAILLLGFVILVLGSATAPGSPFRDAWISALDGPLVPFRNIHKFDPLVRLPLAIGVGAFVAVAVRRIGDHHWRRRLAGGLITTGVVIVLVLQSAPWITTGMRPGPAWHDLPDWWRQAAQYVATADPHARSLLVPGSSFGRYAWGRTVDEPFQPLAASWAVENQLPLGSLGSARVLDAVSSALQAGAPSPGLADLLARSGVRFVVVRNDLEVAAAATTSRARVHATLDTSPGLLRVAQFGPAAFGDLVTPLAVENGGFDPLFPAVEVYRVTGEVPAAATPLADVGVVSGAPEGLLTLMDSGALRRGTPVVMGGDAFTGLGSGGAAVTDSARRRERASGRVEGNLSGMMSRSDPRRLSRVARDIDPFLGSTPGSPMRITGIDSLLASSSASYADAFAGTRPERQPFAALDGDPDTWWQSADLAGPLGQWIELAFPEPRQVQGTLVQLVESAAIGPRVSELSVLTDRGTRTTTVPPGGAAFRIQVPAGTTERLRITVTAAEGDTRTGDVAIRQLTVPGLRPRLTVVAEPLPDGVSPNEVGFRVESPARSTCLVLAGVTRCDATQARGSEEPLGLDRTWYSGGSWQGLPAATGAIRTGPAAAQLFDPIGVGTRARASSWLGEDVRVRASAAVDDDPETGWVAEPSDPLPRLDLTLSTARAVDGMRLLLAGSVPTSVPTKVQVQVGERSFVRDIPPDGQLGWPAVRTDHVVITILRSRPVTTTDTSTGFRSTLGIGIAEVILSGAADLRYEPDPRATTGAACGLGPRLEISGRVLDTRVVTTLGGVLRGEQVQIEPCAADSLSAAVRILPGWQRTRALSTPLVAVQTLTLAGSEQPPGGRSRPVEVVQETATTQTLDVGPGPASILRRPFSANPGWTAYLDGAPLQAVRVDGWQQAWLLPAGSGGQLQVEFAPQRLQRAGLGVGALLVVLFALIVGWRGRGRQDPQGRSARWAEGGPAVAVLVVLAGLLIAGGWGVAAGAAALVLRRWSGPTMLAQVAAVGILLAAAGTGDLHSGWATVTAVFAVLLTAAAALHPAARDGARAARSASDRRRWYRLRRT